MRIQNNVTAENSHRNYGININSQSKNMEKLSSGYRVNRAADDAAGLAISEKMRTQIRGLSRASLNVQDGTSLLQVADGAMQTVHTIIQRMRELAAQSANGTNQQLDRDALDLEYQQLIAELDQIADTTNFNGVYPLKGASFTNPKAGSLTGTGISSAQINPADCAVPNATTGITTIPPGAISGNMLTLTGTGTYVLNSTDLTGINDFNLGPGVTLIINGNMTGPLNFIGSGNVRINGNVNGEVLNDINSKLQITGDVNDAVTNNGKMTLGVPGTPGITFSGWVASNSGTINIANNNIRIVTNSGNARFDGVSSGRVTTNTPSGRVEVTNGSYVDPISTNNGNVFIDNSSSVIMNTNNNRVDIANGGNLGLVFNRPGSSIYCMGTARIGTQEGYLEVGRWSGESSTPAAGSSEGNVTIDGTIGSTSVIRNFSANFVLGIGATTNGVIHNYGTISPATSITGGTVYHYARGYVTNINVDKVGTQSISYTANGRPASSSAQWDAATGGYLLELVAPSGYDGGQVVFNAASSLRIGIMQYSIDNSITIPDPNNTGTSGTSIKYFMEEPFVIQSGANQGDETYLGFRPLNANNLGYNDEEGVYFESIGVSHIKDQDAASAALTVTLNAINDVSIYRAELGAQYNRLEYKYDNLNISTENLAASESRIRDADMAKEMTVFTKNNILTNASTAMLAQANALPQGMLQLLG